MTSTSAPAKAIGSSSSRRMPGIVRAARMLLAATLAAMATVSAQAPQTQQAPQRQPSPQSQSPQTQAPHTPAPQAQAPVFKSGVELIAVDVSVVDKTGLPVRSLIADQFNVTVDGKPRRVISAEFVDHAAPEPPGPSAPKAAEPLRRCLLLERRSRPVRGAGTPHLHRGRPGHVQAGERARRHRGGAPLHRSAAAHRPRRAAGVPAARSEHRRVEEPRGSPRGTCQDRRHGGPAAADGVSTREHFGGAATSQQAIPSPWRPSPHASAPGRQRPSSRCARTTSGHRRSRWRETPRCRRASRWTESGPLSRASVPSRSARRSSS